MIYIVAGVLLVFAGLLGVLVLGGRKREGRRDGQAAGEAGSAPLPSLQEIDQQWDLLWYQPKLAEPLEKKLRLLAEHGSQEEKEEALFRLAGLAYFHRGNFAEAAELYRRLLQQSPATKWAKICEERIALIETGLSEDGAGLQAYARAEGEFEAGRIQEAAETLEKLLREHPGSALCPLAHFFLGDIYNYKKQDLAQALAHYAAVREKWPGHRVAVQAAFKEGECLRKGARWAEAAQAYRRFIQTFPESSFLDQALYHAGHCSEQAGDVSGAIQAYRRLMADHPDSLWITFAHRRVRYLEEKSR